MCVCVGNVRASMRRVMVGGRDGGQGVVYEGITIIFCY